MKHCGNVAWVFWMMGAAVLLAGPAQASLITNGNFESVTGGKFDGWTYSPTFGALVESQSVISGAYSAEIITGGGPISSYVQQTPSELISGFVFECDFAVFPVPTDGNRSANILLFYHPTDLRLINLRVGPGNRLQAYDGSAWQNLGSLTALTTQDANTLNVWDGETPVVNHLMVIGRLAPTGSTYDVILNGISVSGLTYFQGTPPDSSFHTIQWVRLQGSSSDKNWLADNVVFMRIPEPSTGVLLGVGGLLGLVGMFWRRRRGGLSEIQARKHLKGQGRAEEPLWVE